LTSASSNFGLQPLIGKPLALISDARIYGSHSAVVERSAVDQRRRRDHDRPQEPGGMDGNVADPDRDRDERAA
jgi:hypothetical protein